MRHVAIEFESLPELEAPDAQVVSAAAALFLRDGITQCRMTDIAKAAGVGVATLYRHYQTKTRLAILAGTYLWQRFNTHILYAVEDEEFRAKDGLGRLEALFSQYVEAYTAHPEFVRFLDEFDHMVLAEGVDPQELGAYGRAVDSFYIIFEDAYRLGLADGSVTRELGFPVLYRTVAHAMMGIAQKLVRGEVIPSDDFSEGAAAAELSCIIDMAICSLTAGPRPAGAGPRQGE